MSLINKMLIDLEARREQPVAAAPGDNALFEDLRPAAVARPGTPARLAALALLACGLGLAGIYFWNSPARDAAPESQAASMQESREPDPVFQAPPTTPTPTTQAPAAAEQEVVSEAPQLEAAVPALPTETAESTAAEPMATPPLASPPAIATGEREAAPVPKPVQAAPADTPPVIERRSRPLTVEEKAEAAYREGLAQLKQKQTAQAEPAFRLALGLDPTHIQARELLAGLLLESGRWSDAMELLAQGRTQVPSHYPFAQLLARLQVEHGAESEALAVLEQSRLYGKRDAEFLGFLAALYQRAGRHADAVQGYREALSLRPYEGRWWIGIGISLEAEKSWAAAEEAYHRARETGLSPALARYVDERIAFVKGRKK